MALVQASMQTDEELEARTIIFPLGREEGMSTRSSTGTTDAEMEMEVESWGIRGRVVAYGHRILAFYRSFALS